MSSWGIIFFASLAFVYGFGCYVLLSFISDKTREIRKKTPYLKKIHVLVVVAQFILSAILVIVIAQIIFRSAYSTVTLITTTLLSSSVTVVVSLLFAKTFLSWYRSNKKSLIVLLYGLGFAVSAFNLAEAMAMDVRDLLAKETTITPQLKVEFASDTAHENLILGILSDIYQYSALAGFALIYAATVLLLHHYSRRMGAFKFWALMLIPLLYYVSTLVTTLGLYKPQTDSEQFLSYVLGSFNATAGGILFGIAFWTVAKSIRQDNATRDYMIIAAYGFVLFFLATQVGLFAASYPPFGFATYCLLGLSSYMVFLGLYSSAISVSQSIQLRRSIEESIKGDSNLLSSIGTAEMQEQVLRKVDGLKDVVKESEREMRAKSGIESSIPKEDILTYLEEALQEVGKSKKTK